MTQNISETGGMPEKVSDLEKVRISLREPGATNFRWIHRVLAEGKLGEEEKKNFLDLVVAKVEQTLGGGNFGDLAGAKDLLAFLGVDNFAVSDEWIRRIEEMYRRFPEGFLRRLYPTLHDEKLDDGREYDRIEYTREKLKEFGATKEEMTDEFIENLWKVRELLMLMHYNRVKIDKSLTINRLIELKRE